MNIGRLKYKIKIKKATKVKDDYGAVVKTWETVYDTRADVEYMSGAKTENQEVFSSQSLKIKIRYKAEIDEKMRVEMEGKSYRIVYINPLVRKRVLQISLELINE